MPELPTRILFLGFATSEVMYERLVTTDRGMPAQTHRFGWSVIEALSCAGADVVPVSVEPASDYPGNTRVLFRRSEFLRGGVQGITAGYLNITGLKHLTRYLSTRRTLSRLLRRGHKFDAVLIHGVHSPLLWAGLRLGRHCEIPVVTILTDPPSIKTPGDGALSRGMKMVDKRLILAALARMRGVVALAPQLAHDFAPGLPYLWMEGIARGLSVRRAGEGHVVPEVIYAGSLNHEYGVLDLVDSLEHSAGHWCLSVYGRGPAEGELAQRARTQPRLRLGGMRDAQQLAEVYGAARLLVNPRPPSAGFTLYSFPSKLLEFMSSGVPVVTTEIPNIPHDYLKHLIIAEAGPMGLARAIDAALERSWEELDGLGAGAREFILETRGIKSQGGRLLGFLASLRSA